MARLAKALFAAGDNNTAEKCRVKANEIESKVINNSTQEQITNPLEAQNTNAVVTSNSVTHSQSGSGQSVDMGATMSANELLSKPQAQSPTPEPIP